MNPKSNDLKTKILLGAIRLYYRKGVAETTITDIAKTADTSPSQISYHFGSVKDLLPEAIVFVGQHARSYVNNFVDSRKPQDTVLEAYIHGTFKWGVDHPDFRTVWAYVVYLASFDSTAKKLFMETTGIALNRIESALYEHCAKRKISLPNIENVATKIHPLLVGEMIYQASYTKDKEWLKQAQTLMKFINSMLKTAGY